jgi:hypothetical protein
LISAQISGENPAYFGSSESWTLSVPWRGRSKICGGIQVRQLVATMTSGSASLRRSNSSSSSGRLRSRTGTPCAGGQVGDRVAPDLLVGVVALGVRDDEHDVVFGVQQGLQRAVPPGLVAEHDDPHGVPPRRQGWTGGK